MALFYLLICCYHFDVAWGLTISLGNSSAVSASYNNSTTTPLLSKTTVPQTTTPEVDNTTVQLDTTSSDQHDGARPSSGFTASARAQGSGYSILPVTDREGNTTRPFTTVFPLSNSTGRESNTTAPSTTAYPISNSTLGNSTKTISIHATGSGFDYASSCESITRDWLATSSDWFSSNKYSSLVVNTMVESETFYSVDVVPVTLTSCLGHSRELGGQTLAMSPTAVESSSQFYSYLTAKAPPYPVPTPACTFGTESCNLLWDEYDAYNSLAASVWPATLTSTVSEPLCSPYRPGAYCDKCIITGNFAEMYYWPLTAVGEPCDADRSFITATPTIPGQPNTVVFGNNTFTSPTVYLSVDHLQAASGWHPCGGHYSNTFLPLHPEDVSSIRFSVIDNGYYPEILTFEQDTTTEFETITWKNFTVTGTTTQVFFGDFMGAVPADAYSSHSYNGANVLTDPYAESTSTNDVITDAKYSPRIVLPDSIRSMDPYWGNCELHLHGIDDPPVALTAANSIIVPVLPTFSTTVDVPVASDTTPAEPAGQPETPHASATQTAASQSRTSSTAGAVETGGAGPVEPSRTSSRVNPSPVGPPRDGQSSQGSSSQDSPTDGQSSHGSSPQNPSPAPDIPAPNDPDNKGSDPSDVSGPIAGPIEGTPSSRLPQQDQDSTRTQQSITRIATSKPTPIIITLGSSRIPVVQSGSVAIVGGQTLTIGGSAVVIQGQQLSLEPSGIRITSSETVRFAPAPTPVIQKTALWEDGDVSVKVVQQENAVVFTSGSETRTIAFGTSAIVNGHRVDVPSSGGVILIDGSESIPLVHGLPKSTIWQDGDVSVRVVQVNNAVVLTSGTETMAIAFGSRAVVNGHHVDVPASGGFILVDGSEIISLAPPGDPPRASSIHLSVSTESGERQITAQRLNGNRVRLTSGFGSIMVANGAEVKFAGATITVLADGSGVVVSDSSLIPLSDLTDKAGGILPSELFTAMSSGRYVLLGQADGTVTLADGAVTVVDGHTVSAAGDGGFVVVDGSVTQSVVSSSTRVPGGGGGGGIIDDVETTSVAVSNGSGGPLSSYMWASWKVSGFGVMIGMMMI